MGAALVNPTGWMGGSHVLGSGTKVISDVTCGTGLLFGNATMESYNSSNNNDFREFLYSVLERTNDVYTALPTTGASGIYIKPAKMTISKSIGVVSDEVLRKTYTLSFELNIGTLDVVNEAADA